MRNPRFGAGFGEDPAMRLEPERRTHRARQLGHGGHGLRPRRTSSGRVDAHRNRDTHGGRTTARLGCAPAEVRTHAELRTPAEPQDEGALNPARPSRTGGRQRTVRWQRDHQLDDGQHWPGAGQAGRSYREADRREARRCDWRHRPGRCHQLHRLVLEQGGRQGRLEIHIGSSDTGSQLVP